MSTKRKMTPVQKRAMLIAANNGKVIPVDRYPGERSAGWTVCQNLRDKGWFEYVRPEDWTKASYYELTETGRAVLRENGWATTPAVPPTCVAIDPDGDATTRPLPSHPRIVTDTDRMVAEMAQPKPTQRDYIPGVLPIRVRDREHWVELAAEIGYIAHEASEHGFHARVEGRTLDDHGFWPRPDLHDTDAEAIRELHVVIEMHVPTPENENRWIDVAALNLAQLLEWGAVPSREIQGRTQSEIERGRA